MDTIKLRFKDREEYAKVFQQLKDRIYEPKSWSLIVDKASKETEECWDEIVDEALEYFDREGWHFGKKTDNIVKDCLVKFAYNKRMVKALDEITNQMLEDGLEAISELQNNNIVKN